MERVGWRDFEKRVGTYFGERFGVDLTETRLQLGPDQHHKFDLVSPNRDILIECKSFTWTDGGNFPQAKVSTANETILFLSRADAARKMLVMQDDFLPDGRSLVKTYADRYGGLMDDIEVWQYIPQQDRPDKVNKIVGAQEIPQMEGHRSPDANNEIEHHKSTKDEQIRTEAGRASTASIEDIGEFKDDFKHVGEASFERNPNGDVKVKEPQSRYSNADQRDLHPHGGGPFCTFDIDSQAYDGVSGVFMITVDNNIKYVGSSSNLGKYIYDISNISPSACYEGGQQTVCRVNSNIFHAAEKGRNVSFWATESTTPDPLKQQLLERFTPHWNFP